MCVSIAFSAMARTTLLRLSLFASSALAAVVQYNFDVANGQIAPDGVTRNAVLGMCSDCLPAAVWLGAVNGRFPGPLITANKGDTLRVTVNNKLTDPAMRRSTTIVSLSVCPCASLTPSQHWHGLFQPRTADEDGPAFVTQASLHAYGARTRFDPGSF
jgi:iron transport multicopper oxidase